MKNDSKWRDSPFEFVGPASFTENSMCFQTNARIVLDCSSQKLTMVELKKIAAAVLMS